jgi:hypothetical protein
MSPNLMGTSGPGLGSVVKEKALTVWPNPTA